MAGDNKALTLLETCPDAYSKALELLMQGWTPDAVNKQTALSLGTVKAIQQRHPEIAAGQREFLMGNLREATSRLVKHINNNIERFAPKDAALAFGILIDKAQLLQGEATQRVERVANISQEDLIKKLQGMKKARAKEMETVIEAPSQLNQGS
jgi:hypothetical protein